MTAKPSGRVDVGALASGIQLDAAERVAQTIAHAAINLEYDDHRLTEKHHAALIASALRHFDGFELEVADQLKRELGRAGVETWGLDDTLERLLST